MVGFSIFVSNWHNWVPKLKRVTYTNSECSDKPVQTRGLVKPLVIRTCNIQNQKASTQTESKKSRSSAKLSMHISEVRSETYIKHPFGVWHCYLPVVVLGVVDSAVVVVGGGVGTVEKQKPFGEKCFLELYRLNYNFNYPNHKSLMLSEVRNTQMFKLRVGYFLSPTILPKPVCDFCILYHLIKVGTAFQPCWLIRITGYFH